MKKLFLFILLYPTFVAKAQLNKSVDTIKAPINFENIHVVPVASDSLSSSFIIFIKTDVKKHKHIKHTEHVYVLNGEGKMLLGDKTIIVKKGDVIFIPKNTVHSLFVTSKEPMKVMSIQSPYFDGNDRIFVD